MKSKLAILLCLAFTTCSVFADEDSCSFKVINHSDRNFETAHTKGSINNLLVPLCSQNPQIEYDDLAKQNCAAGANNILFSHPSLTTCKRTNGNKFYIQQGELGQTVYESKHTISSINKHVVLHFPDDFILIQGNTDS